MAKEVAIVFAFSLQLLIPPIKCSDEKNQVSAPQRAMLQCRDSESRLRLQPSPARQRILPARVSRLHGRRARLCGEAGASTAAALVGGTIPSAVGYSNDW